MVFVVLACHSPVLDGSVNKSRQHHENNSCDGPRIEPGTAGSKRIPSLGFDRMIDVAHSVVNFS